MEIDFGQTKYASLIKQIEHVSPESFAPPTQHFLLDDSLQLLIFTQIDFSFHYSSILNWMNEDKTVIFLEKNLGKIKSFFNVPFAVNLIQSEHVFIYHYDDDAIIKKIGWEYLGSAYQVHGKKEEDIVYIKRIMEGIMLVAAEFQDFGAATFHNVFQNVLSSSSISCGKDLFGQFQDIPAIIVGAGPSLNHEINQLKAWEKHGLIFAGGSALEALSKENITIHFGSSIDPDPSRHRFLNFTQFTTPFFIQFRMSKAIYREIQGSKIWMGNSPGYPLEESLYESMQLPLIQFDGGWVVSNFLCHVAYLLGCNPIIFIGMDHCWKENEIYTKQVSVKEERKGFIVKDMHGNDVLTRADFFWANDWFSTFAKKHPEVAFINCTSSGLSMPGIEHLSLSAASMRFAKEEKQLQEMIHCQLEQASKLPLDKATVFFQQLMQSMQTCTEYCQKALLLMQQNYERGYTQFEEIEKIIPEITQELFYQKVLMLMWEIWKYPHLKLNPHPQVAKVLLFLDVLNTYLNIFIH
ncbi:MAG: motility associated factor glycosyltransferase family protein [Chlamydiales bacterium]|nr:motility associated factor glycosyltransferase family protein [Chlamydiales bacterium]